MNHQPFRDWLLSTEELTPEQKRGVHEHLKACETCRQLHVAWKEVDAVFHQSPLAAPMPGFSTRFQARLQEYQEKQQVRRVWLSIGISFILVVSSLVIMVSQLWSFVQSPSQYLAMWFDSLISLISIYFALVGKIHLSSTYLPIYTFIGLFFLVGLISFMSVLWLATYKKLTMARRTI